MYKIIVTVSLAAILLSGCAKEELVSQTVVDQYLIEIEQLKVDLEEAVAENKALEFKSQGKEEALYEKIGVLEKIVKEQEELIDYLQDIVKDISGIEDEYNIQFNGIGIGSRSSEVEATFGTGYKTSTYYDEKFGVDFTVWTYENAELSIVNGEVVEIILFNDYYETNFGVNVGDFAYQAINVCDGLFDPYISSHSQDNTPNLGWYMDSNSGTMIMYFNQDEDKFNTGVDVGSARIHRIDLKSAWMFD